MALDNEQLVCKLLRDEWAALKDIIVASSTILTKIYKKIISLTQRLKNIIVNGIISSIKSLYKTILSQFGFGTISNNLIRTKWCEVMYKCKPLYKKMVGFIGERFYNWVYGPDEIKFRDLSEYGLPANMRFTSKYEAFEYMACRLSLRNLFADILNDSLKDLAQFLHKWLDYMDITWWLDHSSIGHWIRVHLKMYENFFKDNVFPHLKEITKYLNCGFALCDFWASTKNFVDDFSKRYFIESKGITSREEIFDVALVDFEVAGDKMLASNTSEINNFNYEITSFIDKFEKLHDNKNKYLDGVTKNDQKLNQNNVPATNQSDFIGSQARLQNQKNPTAIDTPMLTADFNRYTRRETITQYTPTSEVA